MEIVSYRRRRCTIPLAPRSRPIGLAPVADYRGCRPRSLCGGLLSARSRNEFLYFSFAVERVLVARDDVAAIQIQAALHRGTCESLGPAAGAIRPACQIHALGHQLSAMAVYLVMEPEDFGSEWSFARTSYMNIRRPQNSCHYLARPAREPTLSTGEHDDLAAVAPLALPPSWIVRARAAAPTGRSRLRFLARDAAAKAV